MNYWDDAKDIAKAKAEEEAASTAAAESEETTEPEAEENTHEEFETVPEEAAAPEAPEPAESEEIAETAEASEEPETAGDAGETGDASEDSEVMERPFIPPEQLKLPDEGIRDCMVNRELTWLKFNERVLEESERTDVPLCERLNFLSIYQSNLDEFFMVRIGSLKDQDLLKKSTRDNKTGMTAGEQIDACLRYIKGLNRRKDASYHRLLQDLAVAGIRLVDFTSISDEESERLGDYFDDEILPLLSPLITGKRQPFLFMKNKDIYAVAVLSKKNGKKTRLGIIPCQTGVFPRLIEVGKGEFMLSEELILHFIPRVFEGYEIISKSLVRVTRSADIDADSLYDEDLDYRDFMEDIIRKRKRLEAVRLEMTRDLDASAFKDLRKNVGIARKAVFRSTVPMDISFLDEFRDRLREHPEFFYRKRTPVRNSVFNMEKPILPQVLEKDHLLSFPFDSFAPFLKLLKEAASDPDCVSIKMTLYRVAKHSEVIEALCEAAENGKEVLVLVELKARFDEENNISWSRRLEQAGCNVIYGLPGFKVHSKLCLISRRVNEKAQYITQFGTGNYNESTARLYTDYSLITARKEFGKAAAKVFRALAKGETLKKSDLFLVAPRCLQNRIFDLIDEQIALAKEGKEAYIGLKMNSMTDKAIMERLIEASRAGVKIEMVIRGICCLLPGVKDLTENVRIISIVGRFLEHSRVFIFGTGENEKMYISSADFMTRNTLRRVEVAGPIVDPEIKDRIRFMFKKMLADNRQARELLPDGTYVRVKNDGPALNSQEYFYDMAVSEWE